jgi:hypothetical protein
MLNALAGHAYPQCPTFGVTPCPLTIFTWGLLLWAVRPLPKYLLVIPLLWSLLGVAVALKFGVWADAGLLIAGLVGSTMLLLPNAGQRPLAARPSAS